MASIENRHNTLLDQSNGKKMTWHNYRGEKRFNLLGQTVC